MTLFERFCLAVLALLGLLLAPSYGHAQVLPSAPQPRFSKTELSLDAGVYATHLTDYLSTEQCIHSQRCHEAWLPNALVLNKPGFFVFEMGTATAEAWLGHILRVKGHQKTAYWLQSINVAMYIGTSTHNYHTSWKTPPQSSFTTITIVPAE